MTNILKATKRDNTGKGVARALRREDKIPGIIYGENKEDVKVTLELLDVIQQYKTGSFLSRPITLDVDGEEHYVLARDVQLHPVTDVPLHADFLRLNKDSTVKVRVPVRFRNADKSPGLKRGGTLNIVRHDIELLCKPDNIPAIVEINLEGLQIGSSVHISMIALPEGATPTIRDRDFTIAAIAGRGASKSASTESEGDASAEDGEEGKSEGGEE